MVDRNTTISCFRCKKQTSMADLRADIDGKNWICKDCYNSIFQKKKKLSFYATKDLLENIGKKR